ncbi:cytochrome P450 2L1 [Armadillidium vulgare]|nr:cytochrome P450 2L1 [Armadillidium vulgare]
MRIGSRFMVFLCEYKIIQEALQSPAFANRPDVVTFMGIGEDIGKYGVFGTNGVHWHSIRRFMLRHLRDLGMGKSKLVSAIHFEALELVQAFKAQAGKAVPITKAVTPAVINVVWQMVASKRYDLNDKNLIDFQNKLKEFEQCGSGMIVVDIFPWLRSIIPEFILDRLSKKNKYMEIVNQITTWFKTEVNDHMKTLDSTNPRDFIDEYLIEMDKQKDNPDNVMSYEDLIGCISDLFTASLETTATTLNWAVIYLASFPEVQKKLHKEIDNILPDGTPEYNLYDHRLPYLEAFISEVLRYSSLVVFSGLHSVLQDTKFGGYTIPKDSIILPMIGRINYDSKYFDSPKEFKPERFLNSEGKFEAPKQGFIPFGTGK